MRKIGMIVFALCVLALVAMPAVHATGPPTDVATTCGTLATTATTDYMESNSIDDGSRPDGMALNVGVTDLLTGMGDATFDATTTHGELNHNRFNFIGSYDQRQIRFTLDCDVGVHRQPHNYLVMVNLVRQNHGTAGGIERHAAAQGFNFYAC